MRGEITMIWVSTNPDLQTRSSFDKKIGSFFLDEELAIFTLLKV